MRKYSNDSPEAAARIVALALMADGKVDRSETQLLERQGTIRRLGLDHEQFDKVFYEFCEDMLTSAYRLASGQFELDAQNVNKLLDEIRDPALQKNTLRLMLDIVNADRRLTAGEASLIAQALRSWDIDLHEVSDSSVPRHRSPPSTQFNTLFS
ncbi:MAG: TerB family tellurite resistance protein [Azonexus sp.]|nr:TerB family tellurite resistance protein [Azonexus sp.]